MALQLSIFAIYKVHLLSKRQGNMLDKERK